MTDVRAYSPNLFSLLGFDEATWERCDWAHAHDVRDAVLKKLGSLLEYDDLGCDLAIKEGHTLSTEQFSALHALSVDVWDRGRHDWV